MKDISGSQSSFGVPRLRGLVSRRRRPCRLKAELQACFLPLLIFACRVTVTSSAQTNPPSVAALAALSKPAKQIPFKEVIQATTHCRILDFDTNNAAHVALRSQILKAAELARERARQEGLSAARANEAGNKIEAFVKAALKEVGLPARTPLNLAGKAQTTTVF